MNQTRRQVDTAYAKLQNAEQYIGTIENELDIPERWTPSNEEYKDFYQETVLTGDTS